jgi:ribosomal protein L3 glutamine methyltransferase
MSLLMSPLSGLNTLRDFIRYGASQFLGAKLYYGHGMDNAFDEAKFLVLQSLNMPADLDETWLNCALKDSEAKRVAQLIEDRVRLRIPAAYLVGRTWFAGMTFIVNQHVLVPRSPFAELIARGFDGWVDLESCERVLDMCTGSGCIGIASLQAVPHAQIVLVDISEEAIAVAEQNIALHGVQDQVHAIQSDLFSQLRGERYDLIMSNPPYVDAEEIAAMPAEFHHEPMLGLASGVDGLDLTRRLLAEAADHLTENGVLMVEVGASDIALVEAYPELPFFWFEFEHGGMGVFAINRSELVAYADELAQRVS